MLSTFEIIQVQFNILNVEILTIQKGKIDFFVGWY